MTRPMVTTRSGVTLFVVPPLLACSCDWAGGFTSKERDQGLMEAPMDYFGARYMSAAMGRATSLDEFTGGAVDPFTGQQVSQPGPLPYADISLPQSPNKYAYVMNNPLRYTDPDGHCTLPRCIGLSQMFPQATRVAGQYSDRVVTAVVSGLTAAVAAVQTNPEMGRNVSMFGAHAHLSEAIGGRGNAAGAPSAGQKSTPGDPNDPQRKNGGSTTEPKLPDKTVVKQDGVTVEHFTQSGDHGPPHMHVSGQGSNTRIGQAGKPLKGDPPLSSRQAQVVQDSRSTIRKAADEIGDGFESMKISEDLQDGGYVRCAERLGV